MCFDLDFNTIFHRCCLHFGLQNPSKNERFQFIFSLKKISEKINWNRLKINPLASDPSEPGAPLPQTPSLIIS